MFPDRLLISPFLLIHHFAFNYERIIKRIYDRIENEDQEIKISILRYCLCSKTLIISNSIEDCVLTLSE